MEVIKLYEDSQFYEKHKKDLGYDLYAVILDSDEYFFDKDGKKCLVVGPREIVKISVGVSIGYPEGYGGFFKERSGKALEGIEVKGGVIDEQYTGEHFVILKNDGPKKVVIYAGDKIAQLVLIENVHSNVKYVNSLKETDRGSKGFGSSGK